MGFPTICTDRAVSGQMLTGTVHNRDLQLWRVGLFGRNFAQFDQLLASAELSKQPPEKIFISRRGSRILTNEAEIEALLHKRGFQKIYFEDLNLLEQWSLCQRAKVVVAIHGAAIENLAFNYAGVKLIELMHPGYATRFYRRCIESIGGRWCGVTAQMPKNLIHDLELAPNPLLFAGYDLSISPKSIELALDFLA